ncbi:polycomb group RING finger protein [Pimephales promelas]|nr:polycomb group RING finger protein [Pimephales promelas]
MAAIGNPEMLTRKIKLWDINAHITCRLCDGYLIDATTVTECLHTFCRSCLVKYLEENNTCPTCRIVIHQSHPLQYIGHDRTMQDIVYKLVPGLQEAEMKKQREFYQKLGMEVPGDIKGELCNLKTHLDSQRNGDLKSEETANKEAGEEKAEEDNDYHRSDEQVSICLECNSSKLRGLKRKWIRCSAQATVLHLKKFIAKKLNLTSFNEVCDPPYLKLHSPETDPIICLFLWAKLTGSRPLPPIRLASLFPPRQCVSHHADFKAPPRCHDSHKAFNMPHIFRDK